MTPTQFNPPYPTPRPLVAVEVLIDVTQRIQETYRAFVSPNDPLANATVASIDADAIFTDSRFKMVESEVVNILHTDVRAVSLETLSFEEGPNGAD